MPDDEYPDPISRAVRRHHGIAGSPLEKAIRHNAYKLIDTGDGTKTDANLDEFVLELRADPFYASSFSAAPGPAKVKGIGIEITEEQRADIATGKLVPESAKGETASIGPATVQANSAEEFDEMRRSGKVPVVGK